MLREEIVDFFGTDMHNISERRPDTKGAVEWMKKSLDEEYVERVLWKNGYEIIKTCKQVAQ